MLKFRLARKVRSARRRRFLPSLPEYGHAQVLSVPQDELHPLVVVGKADVAGEVDAGASEARDLRRVAA